MLVCDVPVQPNDELGSSLPILVTLLSNPENANARRTETGWLLHRTADEVLGTIQLVTSDGAEIATNRSDCHNDTTIDFVRDRDAKVERTALSGRVLDHFDRKHCLHPPVFQFKISDF